MNNIRIKNIIPYLRINTGIFNLINDFQKILIFALPFYYHINHLNIILLSLYFLLHIYMAIHTIVVYTISAYKNFLVKAEPHR